MKVKIKKDDFFIIDCPSVLSYGIAEEDNQDENFIENEVLTYLTCFYKNYGNYKKINIDEVMKDLGNAGIIDIKKEDIVECLNKKN